MSAPYAEKIEHAALWTELCASSESADLDRRHGNADLQISMKTVIGALAAILQRR